MTIAWTERALNRFFKRFQISEADDCWEWNGSPQSAGYGRITIDGQSYLAHRAAFDLYRGTPGTVVMHTCDNRACVNPNHLKSGTYKENMQDASQKGRLRQKKRPRLPDPQRNKIRRLRKQGLQIKALSDLFGVSLQTVHNILNEEHPSFP